jgi:CTP synthase (UTP-ammonia lyase)
VVNEGGLVRIALVGDYDPGVKAHQAIPIALQMASEAFGCRVEPDWVGTEELAGEAASRLRGYGAVWVVPASPYLSMDGALAAIRYAREGAVPFLGTCGGFQHTLIEYARNVLGLRDADHAETNPDASVLFVSPLSCALRDSDGPIHFRPGSRLAAIYGMSDTVEQYNCRFGLNPQYRERLEDGRLSITATDDEGDARAVELAGHPFFLATLYQPERSALRGVRHPLISAFVLSAARGIE